MQIEEKLKLLPSGPGVYLYRDAEGRVIYAGKALSLKSRVRSYFQAGVQHPPKIRLMVEKVADLETIVTDSEVEALILEQNLIKEHRPHYNAYLKDDKSYPYLKVTLNEEYPRVFITRRHVRDGSRYYGPYTRVGAVHETLRLLKRLFPFRSCRQKDPPKRERPCLNHHIRRCLGACCGLVDRNTYRSMINEVCLFLEGKQDDLVRRLAARMEEAAAKLEFERAAELRDQLQALREVTEKQKIVSESEEDTDIVAAAGGNGESLVMVFFVRGGKLIGREQFTLKGTGDLSPGAAAAAFLKQYYSQAEFIPERVLLAGRVEEEALIEKWLSGKKGAKVRLSVPSRGEKKKLVEMVAKNAALAMEQMKAEEAAGREDAAGASAELARELGLERAPARLECFDISNTQGQDIVASMVVFEEGRPAPGQYRRFKVRTVQGPDDFASMYEVVRRRFERGARERELLKTGQASSREAKFHNLPDLVIVDGGRGQLSAARRAMSEAGFAHIPAFGLAKEEELLFGEGRPEPVALPRGSKALYLVQRLRDEAHRFALAYHRKVRGKAGLKSLLDEIEGIGPARRRALLKKFGSIRAIEEAAVEELATVPGMNRKAAKAVYDFFRK